jgi:predicted double-glycine peptidase
MMGRSGLKYVLTVLSTISLCPGFALGEMDVSAMTYREYLRCGPNSLFLFVKMSGHTDVTLEQCNNAVPISSEGTSLLALRDAARTFRVDAEIRRFQLEDVDLLCLPAIGQFPSVGNNPLTDYHFNVIYKVDVEHVYVIDGISGAKYSILRSRLANFWTGVAMSQRRPSGQWLATGVSPGFLLTCLGLVDVVVIALFLRWLGRIVLKAAVNFG